MNKIRTLPPAIRDRTANHQCGVCILAGGLSRRMGRNKGGLRLGSRTLIGHVRTEAQSLCLRVRIIRRDLVPRCGPLGGVFTGLKSSRATAEIFLACDMPFVSTELLQRLLDSWGAEQRPAFIMSGAGAGFPFLVPVRAVALVERQILKKQFSLQKLAEVLSARLISPPDYREEELFNVNTPADWRMARQKFARAACK